MRTRQSYQRGSVVVRRGKFVLRYRVRRPEGGWTHRAETLSDCPDRKAALRTLDERLREVNRGGGAGSATCALTFGQFIEGVWQQYLQTRNLKPATRYVYASNLRVHLMPAFGDRPLAGILPADIGSFLTDGKRRRLSAKYRLNLYSLLRLIFGVAVDYELLPSSPVRPRIHRPAVEETEKTALTGAQVAAVIAAVELRWRPVMTCLALTGLRAGELVGLQWQHVDLLRKVMRVEHTLWRGKPVRPKTQASRAEIPLSDFLVDVLKQHRETAVYGEPTDYVFGDEGGRPLSPDVLRLEVLYPALERAGIPRVRRASGLHLFRHTAASLVHAQTGSLKMAQTLLRHARLSTTANIYTHVSTDERQQLAEALRQAIFPTCSPVVLTGSQAGGSGAVH